MAKCSQRIPDTFISESGERLSTKQQYDARSGQTYLQITNQTGETTTHVFDPYPYTDTQDALRYALQEREYLIKEAPGYKHPGPTNADLRAYPALKNAWEEFLVVQAMCVGRRS